jgi:methylated-DNA-[protein]-cysteine S-methyltransferase
MFNPWIETPVGVLKATWSAHGSLYACGFFDSTQTLARSDSPGIATLPQPLEATRHRHQLLVERLHDYFSTGRLEWDLSWLDWSNISPFHRQVLEQCAQIPTGKTLTYGELAARAGSPRAARAVGSAMARNRWPLIIPCHRVLGTDGRLTGYSGTGGIETKRRLLGLEAGEIELALS